MPPHSWTISTNLHKALTAVSGATSFRRAAATALRVVARNAEILGFSDRGIDDNGDGMFDRIGITAAANIVEGATYLVTVKLRASNGRELFRTTTQTFGGCGGGGEVCRRPERISSPLTPAPTSE